MSNVYVQRWSRLQIRDSARPCVALFGLGGLGGCWKEELKRRGMGCPDLGSIRGRAEIEARCIKPRPSSFSSSISLSSSISPSPLLPSPCLSTSAPTSWSRCANHGVNHTGPEQTFANARALVVARRCPAWTRWQHHRTLRAAWLQAHRPQARPRYPRAP